MNGVDDCKWNPEEAKIMTFAPRQRPFMGGGFIWLVFRFRLRLCSPAFRIFSGMTSGFFSGYNFRLFLRQTSGFFSGITSGVFTGLTSGFLSGLIFRIGSRLFFRDLGFNFRFYFGFDFGFNLRFNLADLYSGMDFRFDLRRFRNFRDFRISGF